jgi:hypothetical protein
VALPSMPWQAITAVIALISLLIFLPLAWVRASLPTHSAALLLTLLTPTLLVGALLLVLPLYYSIYLEHYHLQNELSGFMVVLVPAVTALGAWILGIVDILRRRAWGWLAPVALLPFLGTLVYGFGSRRKGPEGRPDTDTLGLGSLLLAGATVALLSVLMAIIVMIGGLDPSYDSTPELFAPFGAGVAVVAGVVGGLTLLRGQPAWAAAVLLLTAVLAVQLVAGTSFPIQDVRAPRWAPSVELRVFGIPASEPAGLWVTLGLIATLAAVELTCAPRVAQCAQQ